MGLETKPLPEYTGLVESCAVYRPRRFYYANCRSIRRKEGDMSTKLSQGDKAPDFELPNDRGDMLSLKSFAGKMLVLYFYPKDDTSGCTQEAIDFNQLKHEFEHAGALVV